MSNEYIILSFFLCYKKTDNTRSALLHLQITRLPNSKTYQLNRVGTIQVCAMHARAAPRQNRPDYGFTISNAGAIHPPLCRQQAAIKTKIPTQFTRSRSLFRTFDFCSRYIYFVIEYSLHSHAHTFSRFSIRFMFVHAVDCVRLRSKFNGLC